MHNLFSYGTLQDDKVQMEVFGRQVSGRADAILGYTLAEVRISDPSVVETSGEAVHPILKITEDSRDRIPGFVFSISDQDLERVDEYEGVEYQRVSAQLESGQTAWVYIEA